MTVFNQTAIYHRRRWTPPGHLFVLVDRGQYSGYGQNLFSQKAVSKTLVQLGIDNRKRIEGMRENGHDKEKE